MLTWLPRHRLINALREETPQVDLLRLFKVDQISFKTYLRRHNPLYTVVLVSSAHAFAFLTWLNPKCSTSTSLSRPNHRLFQLPFNLNLSKGKLI